MDVSRSLARRSARWRRRIALGGALAGVAVASHEGAAKPQPKTVLITLVDQADIDELVCTAHDDALPPATLGPPGHKKSGAQPSGLSQTSNSTIVTLTFDDTNADQYDARAILANHGMRATFYINSSRINRTGYMTLSQVDDLVADGHEIAGHTVSHVDLTTVDPDEQARQICDDRVGLLSLGFDVSNFAYPFGATNSGVEQVAQHCGYNSARGVGGVVSPGSCSGCPYAESTTPGDIYHLRTPDSIKVDTTLAQMQQYVTQAEQHGGGWVPLVMHHVCDACTTTSVSAATLTAFLDWLQPRASMGTIVRTVSDVIGGPVQPPVPGPPSNAGALQNTSLDTVNTDGTPTCWRRAGYGTNSARWTLSDVAHSGAYAQKVEMVSLTDGDQKLISAQDLGTCAPDVTPGKQYVVSAWYMTNAPSRLVIYYRNLVGAWTWYAQGPQLPVRSTWTQTTWTTPAMPADATAISIGYSLRAVGWAMMDDFSLTQAP